MPSQLERATRRLRGNKAYFPDGRSVYIEPRVDHVLVKRVRKGGVCYAQLFAYSVRRQRGKNLLRDFVGVGRTWKEAEEALSVNIRKRFGALHHSCRRWLYRDWKRT